MQQIICYQKYLMEKYYYPYWIIAIIPAIALFCINSGLLIIILIVGKNNDIDYFADFYVYLYKVEVGIIIGKLLLNIAINFFLHSFAALTLYNFTPDYILISMQL